MKQIAHIQQGDVLFHKESIPATQLERVVSPVVQEGEHTGHAHRLQMFRLDGNKASAAANWEMFLDKETKTKYLKVLEPTDLTHEEHKTITLPPGEYRIGIVQEYDHFAEEARQVID